MTDHVTGKTLPTKKQIRTEVREHFLALSSAERDARSEAACRALYDRFLRDAGAMKVGLFLSMKAEVETAPLLRLLSGEGGEPRCRLLVPRCDDGVTIRFYPLGDRSDLVVNRYGIPEPGCPVEEAEVPDFLVVPGVAFSRLDGGRVGHGAGFYDRYLAKHRDEIRFRAGLALGFQIYDRVPTDPHDFPLDAVAWEGQVALFPRENRAL